MPLFLSFFSPTGAKVEEMTAFELSLKLCSSAVQKRLLLLSWTVLHRRVSVSLPACALASEQLPLP